ncbi:MAG: hypothetical protein K6G89_02200 [Clostridia bacterium]|nr:hypothetical protein [Clostridia bacterium]
MITDYDDFSSAAEYRKMFYEIGKPIFERHGFQFRNKCFYRKNGDIFQALTLEHRSGRLGVLIVPFWCDIKPGLSHFENTDPLSVHLTEGKININKYITDQMFIDSEYNYVSNLGEGIELFLQSFDSKAGQVVDEKTYVEYGLEAKRSFMVAEEAVIYASFRSASVEYAQHFIDEVDALSLNIAMMSFEHSRPPGRLVSKIGEKQQIDGLFLKDYFRNYRCRFPKIYKFIETGETNIDAFYVQEAQKMRELYKKCFKIDF